MKAIYFFKISLVTPILYIDFVKRIEVLSGAGTRRMLGCTHREDEKGSQSGGLRA